MCLSRGYYPGQLVFSLMSSLSSRLRAGLGVAVLTAAALALPACSGICGPRGGCGSKQEKEVGGCGPVKSGGCGAER